VHREAILARGKARLLPLGRDHSQRIQRLSPLNDQPLASARPAAQPLEDAIDETSSWLLVLIDTSLGAGLLATLLFIYSFAAELWQR
jgi:hypothetical protein